MVSIPTTVNGTPVDININGHEAAVDVIRDQLGLTGTKLVCGGGVCGACTIQLDGEPVAGCLTPATALRDAGVTTVEGLAVDGELRPARRQRTDPPRDRRCSGRQPLSLRSVRRHLPEQSRLPAGANTTHPARAPASMRRQR